MDTNSSSFQEFVRLCEAEELLSRPAALAAEDVCDGLNDQVTLQRFFAARSQNPDGAIAQFKEAINICNSINHIETYDTISVDEYETVRRLYPQWTGRRDKQGRPVFYMDVSHLDKAATSEYMRTRQPPVNRNGSTEIKLNNTQRAVAFHETLTRFILPLCSAMRDRPDPDTPISNATYVADAASFGFKQGYDLRHYAQDITHLLSTSFPEVLKTVYVCNAPSYFGSIWNFLKKWIDPKTGEKVVVVYAADVLSTLETVIDIENIPQSLGGKLDWEAGMPSVFDDGMCQQLEWVQEGNSTPALPRGPVKWIVDDEGVRTAIAVGTVDGKARRERIAVLRPGKTNGEKIQNGQH